LYFGHVHAIVRRAKALFLLIYYCPGGEIVTILIYFTMGR
jgi:hypothetical protein